MAPAASLRSVLPGRSALLARSRPLAGLALVALIALLGLLGLLGLIGLVGLVGPGCIGCRVPPPAPRGSVQHVVVLWLKHPGDEADRAALVAASKRFRSIEGVLDVRVGPPLPSERPIVDDSFDVALVMSFADEAALAGYLADPAHLAATHDVLQPLVERLVVYDLVER